MGRTKETNITKEELKELLEQGLSYAEIGTEKHIDRELVYYYANKWELRDLNVHKQHKDYLARTAKPLKRINIELSNKATASIDITEITFRRQKGKQTRVLKVGCFLSFSRMNEAKTRLVYMKDHKKSSIISALWKLRDYIQPKEIILVDTELNPKLPIKEMGDIVKFCNTTEWHASKNLVEKHHGFKTNLYAKIRAMKKAAYKKLGAWDKALILRLYLEYCERSNNLELLNSEEIEALIKEVSAQKVKVVSFT